jgi:putative addiction module killer protein
MKYVIKKTDTFTEWLDKLKDWRAQARIAARLDAMAQGNFGDWKPIEDGMCELRIDFGPGYRAYYGQLDHVIMLIIGGGSKRTQKRDIAKGLAKWRQIKEEGYDDDEQKN